jgi:hypothetical protein
VNRRRAENVNEAPIRFDGQVAIAPEQLEATVRALKPLAPYMTVENVSPLVMYLAQT